METLTSSLCFREKNTHTKNLRWDKWISFKTVCSWVGSVDRWQIIMILIFPLLKWEHRIAYPPKEHPWLPKIICVSVVMSVSITGAFTGNREMAQTSLSRFLWEYGTSPYTFSSVCSFSQYLLEIYIMTGTLPGSVDVTVYETDIILSICNLY